MREDLFQKIWENYSPELAELRTTHGDTVRLLHTGTLNTGDGPDFENASILYDGIQWHGSIELHITCADWYKHGHHHDIRYNRVILHIVLDHTHARPVHRQDGTLIPTVVLHDYIPQNILSIVRKTRRHHELACSNIIHHISPDVISHQFEIASRIYLNDKINSVRENFSLNHPPSVAWLNMVWISWCDGLGIPKNRTMMRNLCHQFLKLYPDVVTPLDIKNKLVALSGLNKARGKNQPHTTSDLDQFQHALSESYKSGSSRSAHQHWDFSGSRPGNHPLIRIRQAANLLSALRTTHFRFFTRADFTQLIAFFSNPQFSGPARRSILLAISIVPSIHLLGEILGRYHLQQEAEQYWFEHGFSPPEFISQQFTNANVPLTLPSQGPGITSQFKNYCKKKACHECLVFKNAVGG